ncbi:DMT family transporter [uncultured Boseongicola sp.]|jgi:S-adenosylmethionine uptake transporter|uniref:DMT family transporter n=1 Tax=uncultured Boseongicola sp. TaxID=1648499 RepID=UPI002639EDB3|nr:DMT family transporter [uncultured Boseongicola sp.]
MTLTPNLRGALLMTGAMTAFTVNDAFMKLLSDHVPFFQLLFLRSGAVVVLIGLMAWRAGAFSAPVSSKDKALIGLRTVAEIGSAYFFLNALFNLPIANVTAIIQALPLTVTLGAALVLREQVGWRRFLAIGVGFAGVMIIVRPGSDGFTIYSAYGLLAVVCVTARDLAARKLNAEVPSLMVAFVAGAGVLLFSATGAAFIDWQPMGRGDFVLLAFAVFAIIGGYLFSVMAMRVGEIGAVAPFRYTSLLAALLLGVFVFGEWPDTWTQIGAMIVVATGLFTLWRERKSARGTPKGIRVR